MRFWLPNFLRGLVVEPPATAAKSGASAFNQVPPEIVQKILRDLPAKDYLTSAIKVNRSFLEALPQMENEAKRYIRAFEIAGGSRSMSPDLKRRSLFENLRSLSLHQRTSAYDACSDAVQLIDDSMDRGSAMQWQGTALAQLEHGPGQLARYDAFTEDVRAIREEDWLLREQGMLGQSAALAGLERGPEQLARYDDFAKQVEAIEDPRFRGRIMHGQGTALAHLEHGPEQNKRYEDFARQVEAIEDPRDHAETMKWQGAALAGLERGPEQLKCYDTFTGDVKAIQNPTIRAKAMEGQGIALADLDHGAEQLARYNAFAVDVQEIPLRQQALQGRGIALAGLEHGPEQLACYDAFAADIKIIANPVYRAKGMQGLSTALASLKNGPEQNKRYVTFATDVSEICDPAALAEAIQWQGAALAGLENGPEKIKHYDDLADMRILGESEVRVVVLKGQGVALASLPNEVRNSFAGSNYNRHIKRDSRSTIFRDQLGTVSAREREDILVELPAEFRCALANNPPRMLSRGR